LEKKRELGFKPLTVVALDAGRHLTALKHGRWVQPVCDPRSKAARLGMLWEWLSASAHSPAVPPATLLLSRRSAWPETCAVYGIECSGLVADGDPH
jgi:hypothetical protein